MGSSGLPVRRYRLVTRSTRVIRMALHVDSQARTRQQLQLMITGWQQLQLAEPGVREGATQRALIPHSPSSPAPMHW